MSIEGMAIVKFDDAKHRAQVAELWREVFGYREPRNAPELAIDKKLTAGDGLLLVALDEQAVVGTVMAGYDGHRGWIYSMAVRPNWRTRGVGSALLAAAERRLTALGCVKINLQILPDNESVRRFYEANGYAVEERISMGKRLDGNIPGAS